MKKKSWKIIDCYFDFGCIHCKVIVTIFFVCLPRCLCVGKYANKCKLINKFFAASDDFSYVLHSMLSIHFPCILACRRTLHWCMMLCMWWPWLCSSLSRSLSAHYSATDTSPGALGTASWPSSKRYVLLSLLAIPIFLSEQDIHIEHIFRTVKQIKTECK